MRVGERCLLTIQPNYAFEHKDSIVAPPVGLDPGQPVVVDVQVRLALRAVDDSQDIALWGADDTRAVSGYAERMRPVGAF